jgi:hypothetical protein
VRDLHEISGRFISANSAAACAVAGKKSMPKRRQRAVSTRFQHGNRLLCVRFARSGHSPPLIERKSAGASIRQLPTSDLGFVWLVASILLTDWELKLILK